MKTYLSSCCGVLAETGKTVFNKEAFVCSKCISICEANWFITDDGLEDGYYFMKDKNLEKKYKDCYEIIESISNLKVYVIMNYEMSYDDFTKHQFQRIMQPKA